VATALGIDVAESRKGLDLVAVDSGRRIVACQRRSTIADVASAVAELEPHVICIDAPPAWALDGRSRAAERQLRPLGITTFATPTDPGDHPFYGWMRVGFAIFEAVAATYPRYRGGRVAGTAAEVFPHATAVLLAGRRRSPDESKSSFRRTVLADRGVDDSLLGSLDAVDAALAALTGIIALEDEVSSVGDPDEGVILLPCRVD
jgi:predicted nuclease with RNAse H fold